MTETQSNGDTGEYREDSPFGGSTVNEFCDRWRISRSTFYEEVKDRKLVVRKIRGRSIVTAPDEAAWLARLPELAPQAAA